jgi:tRNA U38,U39,U40 pseudouridine synthase TruA
MRDAGGGRTRVELRLAYGVAGSGLSGWLAERIAAPTVRGHLRRTLQQLKRLVEYELLRERAAARKAARTR